MELVYKIKGATASWSHLINLIDKNIPNNKNLMLTYPACLGFTCELALKTIITSEQHSFKKTHDLYKLFTSLNDETQNMIKRNVVNNIPNFTNAMFDFELKENKNVFEDWRFYFESDRRVNLDFLNALYISCATIINNIK